VLESAAPDPNDAATKTCTPPPGRDYTKFLKRDGLRGARIGIPRAYFYDETKVAGARAAVGRLNKEQAALMDEAIAVLKAEGAVIVDPADIPSILEAEASKNFLAGAPVPVSTARRAGTPTARCRVQVRA